MGSVIKKLREKIDKEKGLKIAVAVGLLGMLLILASEFIPNGKSNKPSSDTVYSSEYYREYTEKKLTDMLSEIKGVGRVNVMVTVLSTEEYVYANEEKKQESKDENRNSNSSENKFVIIDGGEGKKPLVTKVLTPEIQGVVIVCDGADSAKVCESVYKSVSAALGIPTTRIYVAKIK